MNALKQVWYGVGLHLPPLSPTVSYLIRLVALAIVDVFAVQLVIGIYGDGNWFLALAIALTTIVVNVINLVPQLWPVRWMSPSFALLILVAIYPIIYTVYVAFTNYSGRHNNTKVIVIDRLETERQYFYLPEDKVNYYWTPFQNSAGEYGLWLVEPGTQNAFFVTPGGPLQTMTPGQSGEGPYLDDEANGMLGIPAKIDDYVRLEKGDRFKSLKTLQTMTFGDGKTAIGIQGLYQAGDYRPRWVYNEKDDAFTDLSTNTVFKANNKEGEFMSSDGQVAPLGFWVHVGLDNFHEIFTSSLTEGPLVRVFLWTVGYALFSVLTSFSMGLLMAILLNDGFRGVRIVRSLLLIPWAMPGMIGILIWRGLLNTQVGIVTTTMKDILGWAPPFFTDPTWAKFSILLVNLWFAYPYFMLICSGALQSIPSSIYEAAEVDGATSWHRFWKLTLPLLLISVGPLLIASFIYNFNNYMLIEALNDGGPQMTGSYSPPVGHTDTLMTYTYNFAFSSEGGSANFGLASAIALLIFMMVGFFTLFQFRLTKRWEEIGENV